MKPLVSTSVRIFRLNDLSPAMKARISAGRKEAAAVWMTCRDKLQEAQKNKDKWPDRNSLQQATKGQFALHSQSIQMVCHAFLANVDTTSQLRKAGQQMKYPWRDKSYYPLLWPAQAVAVQGNVIVLPMGRGRPSIVIRKPDDFIPGACHLVWNGSENELHVAIETPCAIEAPGVFKATVDLGQIHQCAVTATQGEALIVSGRGQRSLKRQKNKAHGELSRLQARCTKGSRRWKKLARTRHRLSSRIDCRILDLAHKGTRAVVDFCITSGVGEVFIGDPDGVRRKPCGRKHNQRMSQWAYGRDKKYLEEKMKRAGIVSWTGSERGTSSRCPQCGHKHKPKGRWWRCKACGFEGHRDLVGSANMHTDNFEKLTRFPSLKDVTYLRPGGDSLRTVRVKSAWLGSSSRPDTGHHGVHDVAVYEPPFRIADKGRVSDDMEQECRYSTEAHSL